MTSVTIWKLIFSWTFFKSGGDMMTRVLKMLNVLSVSCWGLLWAMFLTRVSACSSENSHLSSLTSLRLSKALERTAGATAVRLTAVRLSLLSERDWLLHSFYFLEECRDLLVINDGSLVLHRVGAQAPLSLHLDSGVHLQLLQSDQGPGQQSCRHGLQAVLRDLDLHTTTHTQLENHIQTINVDFFDQLSSIPDPSLPPFLTLPIIKSELSPS